MEAITIYWSLSHAFVHCRLQTHGSFIPVHYFNSFRKPMPKPLVVARARPSIISDQETADRPLFQFPPSLLNHHVRLLPVNQSEMDELEKDIKALVVRVSEKLDCLDMKERILLIHTLVTLGVAYHFEKEIEEVLKDAFEMVEDMIIGEEDMYTISVIFRVFRLYGHNISSDMFNRFKGEDGNFKKNLINDVRGMLSLYEATHFGTTTEEILDEAMHFTQKHLEQFVAKTNNDQPHISKLIQSVLYLPQQENYEVLAVREYIRFYEQEPCHDEMLLKFSKLNFKFMQLNYMKEIQILAKWWEELDLESKIPDYFRERVVESLFWAVGVYMEPRYSVGRIILSKYIALITVLDDACDAYCTLSESIGLIESLQRWEADAIDALPDHLKVIVRTHINFFEELKEEMRPQGRLYSVQYTIDELKRLGRGQLAIAKWARAKYVPNYDEYMEVGLVTAGIDGLIATAFIGMGEIACKDAYKWLISRPKFIQTLDRKGRLRNDIATYKDEMARGEIATGVNCYMKQYQVTEEEALLEFDRKIKHTSKILNEEFFRTTGVVPRKLGCVAFNFARLADVNYKYGDGLTYTETMKDPIASLFFDIITI